MDVSEIDTSTWTCKYCEVTGQIEIKILLEPKPYGTFSLAGVQAKTTATEWPYAICGHKSRGSRT